MLAGVTAIEAEADSMRACVYREKGVLAVEQRPLPTLGEQDVLLRVSHCGVCGTDLHLVMEGWGRRGSIGGHEYAGEIVAVGRAVQGLSLGDRVVGGPTPGCGRCDYCLAHRPGLCSGRPDLGLGNFQGAFAEFKAVDAREVLRVPDSLGLREAALCEPLAVALHGITLSGIAPGESALVTGAGPIGTLTVAALIAMGVEDVTVSEPAPLRRKLAEQLGARRVVEPESLAIPTMPFSLVDEPWHHVFECSGKAVAVETALAQLRRAGTLVLVGTGMAQPRLDANRVILNELRITGSYNYDEHGFETALSLLDSGRLPTQLLIESADVSLDGLQQAMEALVDGRLGGKVMVAPDATS
jgi:(R,R)-butanediol dehydrogenase/meso-butanediol dehydrogenase/diacetyl reductase